jgi:hypothetical protein
MQNNGITDTHGETPFATVKLTPGDIAPRDWAFLREWANNLGVSIEVLLKRILIAAIIGQLCAKRFLRFEIASRAFLLPRGARGVSACDLTTQCDLTT